jgi:ABC-type protease/lipase transport system fused ATPase/permease subunit
MSEYLRLFDAESLRQFLNGSNPKSLLLFAAAIIAFFVLVVFVFRRKH